MEANKLYDLDTERAVLGGVMYSSLGQEQIGFSLDWRVFYDPDHAEVCKSVVALINENKPIDTLNIWTDIKKRGKLTERLTPVYIQKMTDGVASLGNMQSHYKQLEEYYMKRQLSYICKMTDSKVSDVKSDIFNVLDEFEKSVTAVTEGIIQSNFQSSEDLHFEMILRNKRIIENRVKGIASGVPSGFDAVDYITGGWQKSDLIILAARPAMGKTAFALSIARNAAVLHNKPTALFSLEMSNVQLYARLQAAETNISLENILRKGLDDYEQSIINQNCIQLMQAPIFVDDQGGLTVFQLRNKARRLKREKKIELIIIDYIQLMRSGEKTQNREAEISYISRSLKMLAKELDIPIIALSQLSRSVESRADKIPMLSDLRESGAIEQDADMVLFIYRPEYYQILTDENGNSTEGKAMILIEKHRNGSLGKPILNFEGRITKFSN